MLDTIVGIDPGLKGGIAVLTRGVVVALHPMPINPPIPGMGVSVRTIDTIALLALIPSGASVVMESPQCRSHGLDVKTIASAHLNVGIILGALHSHGFETTIVPAITWTNWIRRFQAPGAQEKEATASAVIRLHPEAQKRLYGPRGGLLDGQSDACGIACWFANHTGAYDRWAKTAQQNSKDK